MHLVWQDGHNILLDEICNDKVAAFSKLIYFAKDGYIILKHTTQVADICSDMKALYLPLTPLSVLTVDNSCKLLTDEVEVFPGLCAVL